MADDVIALDDLLSGSQCSLIPTQCVCGVAVLKEVGGKVLRGEPEFWIEARHWHYRDAEAPILIHECDENDEYQEFKLAWAQALIMDRIAASSLRAWVQRHMALRPSKKWETPRVRSRAQQKASKQYGGEL